MLDFKKKKPLNYISYVRVIEVIINVMFISDHNFKTADCLISLVCFVALNFCFKMSFYNSLKKLGFR